MQLDLMLLCMLCRSLADRQAVSLAVRPTLEHYLRMSANWWWRGDVAGLRDRSMFKEQMYTAGRGGDIRELEYADRFTYLYHTRPMEAVAIVSIKQNGKTNQVGTTTGQSAGKHKVWNPPCHLHNWVNGYSCQRYLG